MSSRDAPIFSRDSCAERKDRNVEARHKKLFPTESRTGVYVQPRCSELFSRLSGREKRSDRRGQTLEVVFHSEGNRSICLAETIRSLLETFVSRGKIGTSRLDIVSYFPLRGELELVHVQPRIGNLFSRSLRNYTINVYHNLIYAKAYEYDNCKEGQNKCFSSHPSRETPL